MRHVNLGKTTYIAADIVEELIANNREQFEDAKRHFLNLDLCIDRLPKADLILCRDCLVHLRLKDGVLAIKNMMLSGSKYILTSTYPSVQVNRDIYRKCFLPLNLCLPFLCLPQPMELIKELSIYEDGVLLEKFLGFWRAEDLREKINLPSF